MSSDNELGTKISDLHARGAQTFGFTWLACHEVIAAAYRRAGVVDPMEPAGSISYPLRYAACQIAWAWCEDIAALKTALKGGTTQ